MDNMKKVLIVDDSKENLDVLYNLLKDTYEVHAAKSGKLALRLLDSELDPDIILLDIMMPEISGYDVCKKIKNSKKLKKIPIIFITAKNDEIDEKKGFEAGAVDYITKPINPVLTLERVKVHISLYEYQNRLEELVLARTKTITNTRKDIIKTLSRAGEFKDNETGFHVLRMGQYSYILGKKANLSQKVCNLLLEIVPMHDIGKIGIPDKILLKNGKLTKEEWEIMKTHTQIGADILGESDSELIKGARECAISHHEWWNGKGYPYGLSGEEIPLYGRIAAITDVFDALTSDRPYKKAWIVEDAIKHLEDQRGKQFDPQLLDLFLECIPDILKIKEELND